MPFHEVLDWIVRALVGLGIPSLTAKYLIERRRENKTKAALRKEDAQATVEEKTTGDKIAVSSVSTLESQIAAMARAFEIERVSKDRTIEFQAGQLESERAYSRSRDALIVELRTRVEDLQRQLGEIAEQLQTIQRIPGDQPKGATA